MTFDIKTKNGICCLDFENILVEALLKHDFTLNKDNPDVVIILGGDGTFLRVAADYLDINQDPIYVAINFGRLGFLTSYTDKEIDLLINDILTRINDYKEIKLLKVEVDNLSYFAINEARIMSNNASAVSFDVLVDGKLLESVRGDGFLVTTSRGSTGLNKSLKGPLVDPSLDLLILNEIAPVSNKFYSSLVNPLILDGSRKISLIVKEGSYNLYVDTKNLVNLEINQEIKFSITEKTVKVLFNLEYDFLTKIKEGFLC